MISKTVSISIAECYCTKICTNSACYAHLQIVNGPTLLVNLRGKGTEPYIVFSPSEVNFGLCFLHQPEMVPKTVRVAITNEHFEEIRFLHSDNYSDVFYAITHIFLKILSLA